MVILGNGIRSELKNSNLNKNKGKITVSDINDIDYSKKLEEYKMEFAKAEADLLENKHTYSSSYVFWFSTWGFYPLVNSEIYTSTDSTQPFKAHTSAPWEANLQGNFLWEGKKGTMFFNVGYRIFNNNSALADLLTQVDYNQYTQFVGSANINYALLQSDKAYIGTYSQFVTNNINSNLVLMLPFKGFCNFGISGKIEKNFGDYLNCVRHVGVIF